MTYNDFTADTYVTSRCDLDFWPLTLNVCGVFAATWSNSVSYQSEIVQSAAQVLQRFKHYNFGVVRHIGFDRMWILMFLPLPQIHNASIYQISAKFDNSWLS